MLTKAIIKYIRSLKEKKNRDEHRTFVVEGNKMVTELLSILDCEILIYSNLDSKSLNLNKVQKIIEVKDDEISKVSLQKNPQQMLAVFYQPESHVVNDLEAKLSLVLDEIQDPGNLGTIVRLADWYGIENIFCSRDTADIYNPKTVQATMGALARVRVHYCDLEEFLISQKHLPIYGTFLDGRNIYEENITPNGLIVMGNEGKGISKMIEKYVNQRLFIPSYPAEIETSESLNVAVATAITCAEFRRRML